MISLPTLLLLVWLHFLADFLLQTQQMAVNKSRSIKWLSIHALTYSAPFILISPLYAVINGILHWLIDFVTSKLTSRRWAISDYRGFFIIIGIDQAIHFTCLFSTYILLF